LQLPLEVFINGILGVFAGMAMLYLAIKIISATAGKPPAENKDGDQ
jgi:hypothetical protein